MNLRQTEFLLLGLFGIYAIAFTATWMLTSYVAEDLCDV